MRIRVLGCSGGSAPGRAPSCYLLDRGVAVDAGALASALTVDEQYEIRHVLLTHAHWDHCRDLPLHVINRRPDTPTLMVHALPETIHALRTHLMNAEVWFKAFDLPSADSPFIAAEPIRPGDILTTTQVLYSVSPLKTTKLGTGRFWDFGVRTVNQRGELCAEERYTGFGYNRN